MRARILGVWPLLALLAAPRAEAQCNNDFILISTSDLYSFSTSLLDPVNKTATNNVEGLLGIGSLRTFGGRVFVITDSNRIQGLDPCNNFDPLFTPISTGLPSTPRDLVMVSPTLGYITRYERTSMLRFNPSVGFVGEVSLLALGDADGLAEMDQMFAYGGRLYVCLQRTSHADGNPTGTSMLAVVELATEAVLDMDPVTAGVQGIPLVRQKPYSEVNFRALDGSPKVYFAAIGFSGVLDGGVIECDAADPSDQSVILTEANAGGDIIDVEIISDTKGFAIVTTATAAMELIAFNPSTGLKIGSTMFTVGGNPAQRFLTDIEPSSLGLLLADFSLPGGGGIRCFDMSTNTEIPGGPINVGYPPFDILVRDGPVTNADHAPVATTLGRNYPNPFNPATSIPFSLASGGRVALRIYDVGGRLVATLLDEQRNAGEHVARWDGRTDTGSIAPMGVYFARLENAGSAQTRKIVLLR
jgi:hypothetical protein